MFGWSAGENMNTLSSSSSARMMVGDFLPKSSITTGGVHFAPTPAQQLAGGFSSGMAIAAGLLALWLYRKYQK